MNKNKIIEILLVEDNPNDEELTLHALKKNHLINKIHIARDGEEALDFLFCRGAFQDRSCEVAIDFVLLDLKLPKVDGLEVLRQIRANDRTKMIPVIALTSSQLDQDITESYRLGVNSFVSKPVEFNKFTEAVSEIGMYWAIINQSCPNNKEHD